jgi:hypothetical protein
MERRKIATLPLLASFLTVVMMATVGWPEDKYEITFKELEKYKGPIDDPAPFYKNTEGFKKIIPPEAYKRVAYDVEAMKGTWAEVIGFKAPEVVGKIVPEIQPGNILTKTRPISLLISSCGSTCTTASMLHPLQGHVM